MLVVAWLLDREVVWAAWTGRHIHIHATYTGCGVSRSRTASVIKIAPSLCEHSQLGGIVSCSVSISLAALGLSPGCHLLVGHILVTLACTLLGTANGLVGPFIKPKTKPATCVEQPKRYGLRCSTWPGHGELNSTRLGAWLLLLQAAN